MTRRKPFYRWFTSDIAILVYLAVLKIVIHFVTNGNYGYFRDELYYIACSDRLDWGYVDHPPLSLLVLAMARGVLGDSIFAIRLPAVLAGGATVFLVGFIARELGGGRFAQCLAALAALISPTYLAFGSSFSMNAFDLLFWTISVYTLVRLIKTGNPKLWILFGLVTGLGLQNKISVIFLGFGVVLALLFAPQRKHLLTIWPWLGGGLAFLIFVPHLIWQIAHDWPTLEFIRVAKEQKIVPLSPLQFFAGTIVEMHPFNFPIWLVGLCYFLFCRDGKVYRMLGLAFVTVFALLVVQHAKVYYLAPAFSLLLPGGSVLIEKAVLRRTLPKVAIIGALVVGGLILAPLAVPALPVDTFIRYSQWLRIGATQAERHEPGALPQYYADRFGWENMAATVAKAYNTLSPEERAQCTIFTSNYGEAGAIDFFGRQYNLPRAISGHNNYWLWGPGDTTGRVMIVIGPSREDLEGPFDHVEEAAVIEHPYAMPYENDLPVYVCKRPRQTLEEAWPLIKHFE